MAGLYSPETGSGIITSFIPLTTAFTASEECSSYYRLDGVRLMAFDPGYGLDIDSKVRCLPSAVTTWWEQGRLGNGDDTDHTAISIGPLTCPYRWSTVASSIKDVSSTLAMCCPFGYSLDSGDPGSVAGNCLSEVPPGAKITYQSTKDTSQDQWVEATVTLPEDSFIGAIAIVGWNINQVTSTLSSPSSPPSTVNSIIASTSATPEAPPKPSSSAALSPFGNRATTAGVSVGIAFGAIGIVSLLVAIYIIRRKKRNTTAFIQTHLSPQPPGDQPVVPRYDPQQGPHMYELAPVSPKFELSDSNYQDKRSQPERSRGFATSY